ncbi:MULTISPECIES: hypothetical protein [unclassified Pseudoalteromonas]|uniref:hypothetical protein n=1 Tax=unclassified Pseudoalteromonas TaxID=194690 RepID=UPI0018CDBE8F|nr:MULTISPECIES: hypothetical protein [unclassified Pseudoalteromonas]MBH0029052.1 hypothetical protein [Pseudoalteromonas sp. SWN29]MBH0039064.1 hypothetical protein [Pseudoalteromonas sp. SWN166]MBH0075129.1 hypothetical protein [Pseudoalteromonas sp. SWYJ118]
MDIKLIDCAVKIAACVCGKDGVISHTEELAIYEYVNTRFSEYSQERFNDTLDEFFDENHQIEMYLNNITDINLKKFIINLCEFSAGSDGLDIKENIALDKVKIVLSEGL